MLHYSIPWPFRHSSVTLSLSLFAAVCCCVLLFLILPTWSITTGKCQRGNMSPSSWWCYAHGIEWNDWRPSFTTAILLLRFQCITAALSLISFDKVCCTDDDRWSRGETRKAEYVSLAASFLFHICVFCCNGSLSQCWWEHSCLSTWQPSTELSLPLIFVLLQLVVVTLLISHLAIIAQSKDAHVLWLTLIYYVVQSAYDWWFRVREWDT